MRGAKILHMSNYNKDTMKKRRQLKINYLLLEKGELQIRGIVDGDLGKDHREQEIEKINDKIRELGGEV